MRKGVVILVCLVAGLWLLDKLYPLPVPYQDRRFAQVVVASDGVPLRAFADKNGIWRQPVSIEQVSADYLDALLHYEDRYFYYHIGINPVALVRAAWQWLTHGRIISGGSTLTMQVARLLDPHDKTIAGKLQQIARALQLEWHYSKQEILTLYLNLAPFGGTIEGVQAASYAYFGKSASQLSQAEAALLAIMPQAPSRYRPDRHPQRARQARDKLVNRLINDGIWPASSSQEIALEPVFAQRHYRPMLSPLLARHLINEHPDQALIETSLKQPLQQSLQQLAADYLEQYPPHTGLALLVFDNQTQRPIGYLGSGEFGSAQRLGYIDMVQAFRSPGSTLKPAIFGLALDQGLIHSESLLVDAPRQFSNYRPGNFSGKFRGPVSAAEALRLSLNVPAVELMAKLTPPLVYSRLANAGVQLKLTEAPGLPMALGAAGANLQQLVALYATLMNQGHVPEITYLKQQTVNLRPLLSPQAAWIIYQILRQQQRPDRPFDSSATGRENNLAWKTGTSSGYRDMWAIGVSPKYTIGVWIGRPDGTPMPGHYGSRNATPLLFMIANLLGDETPPPPPPPGVTQRLICWPLGKPLLETTPSLCQQQRDAWLIDGATPDTLLAADGNQGPLLRTVWRDRLGKPTLQRCNNALSATEIALWPLLAEPWIDKTLRRRELLPQASCDQQVVEQPLFLVTPRNGSQYTLPRDQSVLNIDAYTIGGSKLSYWYLDGEYLGERSQGRWSIPVEGVGKHQLLVSDELGNSDLIEFELVR